VKFASDAEPQKKQLAMILHGKKTDKKNEDGHMWD
jgi:hypothetical protein